MSLIYEPKGRAREYSPLALNLYMGCSHGCKYCYAPDCTNQSRAVFESCPLPRKDLAEKLASELKKSRPSSQVLLSFIGDVYGETSDNNQLTHDVLSWLSYYKVPTAVLTKGGSRCVKDIPVFKKFDGHFQVGATLTFTTDDASLEWEPGAALPGDRLLALSAMREQGIQTFASFEPVVSPEHSLDMIRRTLEMDNVDSYKIGKLSHMESIARSIDWTSFLRSAVDTLREAGKPFYVKHDLRLAAPGVLLYGNEVLSDEHCVT